MGIFTNNVLTRAFWGDEAWTALISALPLPDLLRTTAADFHPPLYYTIIHFWIRYLGNGEVTVRVVSLAFWLLAGISAYLFGKSLRLPKLFTFCFLLSTLFNPFVFLYAFEARSYTLLVFLSLVSMWQFYEIVKSRKPSFPSSSFYLLSSLAGLYTHYYMVFAVAAQYLFILLLRRDLIRRFLRFAVIFFLFYVPWLPIVLGQAKSVAGGYWIGPLTWETIISTAAVLVRGEQEFFFYNLLPGIFTVYLLLAFVWGLRNKKIFSGETALFLFWALVPFIAPVVISFMLRPIFFYRYLVFAALPVAFLPLYWLSLKSKSWLALLAPSLLLLIYLYSDYLAFTGRTQQLFKPILTQIHKEAKKTDVIYTVLPSFAEVVYYNNYDGRALPIRVLPVGLAYSSGKALLDTYIRKGYLTLERAPTHGRYWLLEPGPKYELVSH